MVKKSERTPVSKDRNDHYIPQHSKGGQLHDLTGEDIQDVVLMNEYFTGIGRASVHRGIALGLKDELNRGPGTQFWADYSDTTNDGEAHWSSFQGHHICVDVDIRQVNEREVNSWKGRDEVRGRTYAKVLFNKEPVYEISRGDLSRTLLQLQVVIPELMQLPALTEYLKSKMLGHGTGNSLIGRKVFYQNHPGIIKSFIGEQGCVMIEADPGPWPTPAWAIGNEDMHEGNENVKTNILSPHIWWYRD
jgi:hypothetical protein